MLFFLTVEYKKKPKLIMWCIWSLSDTKRIFVHSGTVQRTHHRSRFQNTANISMGSVSPSLLPRSVLLLSLRLKRKP